MNKSKSQSQLPNRFQTKNKSDFIYTVQDDAFIFQTKDLFLQVQFKSPIKEICQYLQQYEKYCFLANISSVGVKAQQERDLYDKISISVHNEYQKFLEKTMGYIEDMIMNIHFMKFEKWHYYNQIVKGYKTNLLNKDLDCYEYNPAQFDEYYKKVMEYLINLNQKSDPTLLKQRKMELKANQKQIIRKAKQINENMYVKNPFKTQNCKGKQIESSQAFQTYFKKVIYGTYGLQEAFDLRFHSAYEGIHKFSEFIKQFSLAGQNVAANIIKDYNQVIYDAASRKKQLLQRSVVKQDLDMGDFYGDWQKCNANLPILRNKMERVNFSNRIVWREEETSESFALTTIEDNRRYRYDEDDEIFTNRVPANNPYYDFWVHAYDRERLRKLQLFYEQPKQNQQRIVNRDFNRRVKRKLNKERKFIQQNVYQVLIAELKAQEEKLWSSHSKKDEANMKSYQNIDENEKKAPKQSKRVIYSAFVSEEAPGKLGQQRRVGAYKEHQQKFEEDSSAVSLRRTGNDKKIYEQFAIKFNIKDLKRECSKTKVKRYGIVIEKYLFANKDLAKLQQFICNFLREKLFREVQKYREKESMPLIMNFKPACQFCNWRTIKKLGELTQAMKRYYIWASEVIKYQEITAINKEVSAKFTIYSYTELKHSQSIMFELKRRLNVKVGGQIVQKYSYFDENSLECIISKLELMHRLLFNQHSETANVESSFLKGEQLFNLIMKQVSNDSVLVAQQ